MSAQPEALTPDHRAVLADLSSAAFREGATRGQWRVIEFAWPHLVVGVSAAVREASVAEVVLRMDLNGFPQQAPTSTPWDVAANQALPPDRRPRGEFAAHVFRTDWEGGVALYAPYDRVALTGHPSWPEQHPMDMWTAQRSLAFVLTRVFRLLNDDDYEGCS